MMRKFTSLLLVSLIGFCFLGCEDKVDPPASPAFTVDRNTGLSAVTEFVFTVNQVGANAIALLPYGTELPNKGGVLVNPARFVDGRATIRFLYDSVGTFNAVVVASNFTSDGETIKRTVSAPTVITISSNQAEISSFSLPTQDSVKITQPVGINPGAIAVFVPFGTSITNVAARFSASRFSTVRVGTVVQASERSTNNFTNPVTYAITSQSGVTRNYVVTTTIAPVETLSTVRSANGVAISKAAKNAAYTALVDNAARNILILAPSEAQPEYLDSIRVRYQLTGKFARMNIGTRQVRQDTVFNLLTARSVTVVAQNGASANYNWLGAIAPKLELSLPSPLLPTIVGKTTGFGVELRVLVGTNLNSLTTNAVITARPGTSITAFTANGVPFVSGNPVAYTDKKAEFRLTVNDTNLGITYVVTYNANVTVLE